MVWCCSCSKSVVSQVAPLAFGRNPTGDLLAELYDPDNYLCGCGPEPSTSFERATHQLDKMLPTMGRAEAEAALLPKDPGASLLHRVGTGVTALHHHFAEELHISIRTERGVEHFVMADEAALRGFFKKYPQDLYPPERWLLENSSFTQRQQMLAKVRQLARGQRGPTVGLDPFTQLLYNELRAIDPAKYECDFRIVYNHHAAGEVRESKRTLRREPLLTLAGGASVGFEKCTVPHHSEETDAFEGRFEVARCDGCKSLQNSIVGFLLNEGLHSIAPTRFSPMLSSPKRHRAPQTGHHAFGRGAPPALRFQRPTLRSIR